MTVEQQKELFYRSTPISNILLMQKVIDKIYYSEKELNKLPYHVLHQIQDGLISEYNTVIKLKRS